VHIIAIDAVVAGLFVGGWVGFIVEVAQWSCRLPGYQAMHPRRRIGRGERTACEARGERPDECWFSAGGHLGRKVGLLCCDYGKDATRLNMDRDPEQRKGLSR
jgi:hypothetical protein